MCGVHVCVHMGTFVKIDVYVKVDWAIPRLIPTCHLNNFIIKSALFGCVRVKRVHTRWW